MLDSTEGQVIKENVEKERGTVCAPGDSDDLCPPNSTRILSIMNYSIPMPSFSVLHLLPFCFVLDKIS